jgi:hypothetical protein
MLRRSFRLTELFIEDSGWGIEAEASTHSLSSIINPLFFFSVLSVLIFRADRMGQI